MALLKTLSLLLFVCVLSFSTVSQIDSLENVLATTQDDSVKIQTCFELYGLYSLNNPEKAGDFIDQAFELSESAGYERGIILCYDKWGGIEMMNSNYPKAIEYYTKADSLLQRMEWPRQQAVIYGNLAGIYKDKGEFDQALVWNEKFTEIAEKLENPVFIGFGKGIHGDIYHVKGHFSLAAKYHLESLRNYEESADSGRIADGCLKLGQAHLYGNRYEDAEQYLKKAQRIYASINDLYFWLDASETLGYLELQREDFSAAEQYFATTDSLAQILNVDYATAQALDGKVDVAYGLGNYEEALRINEKSMALFKQLENSHEHGWAYSKKARALHRLNRNSEALIANSQAEAIFNEYDLTSGLKATHQNFYNIYKSQGDYPSALASLESYITLNDSLVNAQTQTQIEELQIIYDTEKREQQLELVKKENELLKSKSEIEGLKKQRMWWLIAGLCVLALVIIFWQYQAFSKNKRIAQEKTQRQAAELEAQKIEKEQIERELASHVLQLCQQNELLTSVKDKVSSLVPQAGEKNQTGLINIERELNFSLQNKESWKQFLTTFEKVHPNFLERLQSKADRLSPAEQRLACLLKMNLSSKQMASILCISPEGIKKARYRLRKKLKVDSEVNLTEYLAVA